MTTLTAEDMQTWHIGYRDDRPPESVQAAYPAGDDSLPGFVILKDWRHQIVAMIPVVAAAIIQRCPNDPEVLRGLTARLAGGVRATGCLPRELEGDTDGEAAKNEVALRTQLLRVLMRARIDEMGENAGFEYYAYLSDDGPDAAREGEILDIAYEDGDRFGPRLHVMLTGYSGPRKIDLDEALAPEAASALAAAQ